MVEYLYYLQNRHLNIFGQSNCPEIIRDVHSWGQKHQTTTTKATTQLQIV